MSNIFTVTTNRLDVEFIAKYISSVEEILDRKYSEIVGGLLNALEDAEFNNLK